MTNIIDATVFRGFGVASKNIKYQLPHLAWLFPEIRDIFPGSINVRLDSPLRNLSYDYTTLPTPWWDVDQHSAGRWAVETFSFLRIGFESPTDGPLHRAWIFDCHNSRWFADPLCFEVITEKVADISDGMR